MSERLAGKVAIVTGGGKGIGAHFVRGLAANGARVAAVDIDGAAGEAIARRLCEEGLDVIGIQADVSDAGSVERMTGAVADRFGGIDILVNNAALFTALFPHRPFDELSEETWDKVMAVNVKGPWLCARAAYPFLKASGRGRIINIASDTALNGAIGLAHYVSSKGAVIGFTRALSREVGQYQITVNAIAPGLTASDTAVAGYPAEWFECRAQLRSLKRVEVPEDLVGTLVFLASDDSAFMTGQTLAVNGGSVLH